MKLVYHDSSHGKNFGDLLNEPIFAQHLGEFLDRKDDIQVLGIGSILGLDFAKQPGRKLVFSSGFAYGKTPTIDSSYEFICVRGPLTAKHLNLPAATAVADGAYLIRSLPIPAEKKRFDCSVIMHWHNIEKYAWQPFFEDLGIHFIDPTLPIEDVTAQLLQSRLVLAEAMHGAIVADALRVPWLPVTFYPKINAFKWQDFCQSMDLDYQPFRLPGLFGATPAMDKAIRSRTNGRITLGNPVNKALFSCFCSVANVVNRRKATAVLKELKQREGLMSSDIVVEDRHARLLEKLEVLKEKLRAS